MNPRQPCLACIVAVFVLMVAGGVWVVFGGW